MFSINNLAILVLGTIFVACSSSGVKVIERADDLSERPTWASSTKGAYKKDNINYFVGFVVVPGDSSPSAAYNMSDQKALAASMQSLVDDFMDQNSVGEDLKNSTGQRLISSIRKSTVPMPSLQISSRYWERVKLPEVDGAERTELRVFSLAEVPTGEFTTAKQQAFEKLKGEPEIKSLLSDVAQKQRDKALGQ